MNKKYLKENNLYEAHKQFMRLVEWSQIPSGIMQEDDDDDAQDMGGGDDMGADPNGGMQDPNAMGENDMQDPNGNDPNMMGGDMGADPNGGMPQDPNAMGGDMMGQDPMMDDMGGETQDDDVIDVEDITSAQEHMNDKVNTVGKNLGKVDDKIKSLMTSLNSIEQMINANNAEIENLKKEFNKRNPTPTERLQLRSLDSYPYNIKPTDYWKEKGNYSNYKAEGDNNKPTTDEYEITNNDVDDLKYRDLQDSFFVPEDMKQDINKIFGF